MDDRERAILTVRSQAGNAAMRIVLAYGTGLAPDLIAEAADTFIRALGAVTSPQEANDRLGAMIGAAPRQVGSKPRLVVCNS